MTAILDAINGRLCDDPWTYTPALLAVLDLHKPAAATATYIYPRADYCRDCDTVWPCRTVAVIADAVGAS